MQKHLLLIVEDDAVLNRLLVRQLEKAGYEVHSATNWASAQQSIATHAPDLVLLDVNLPDARGFVPLMEVAPTRPVVMLTAYGSVNQAVEAMRLGATDYLIKPVNLDELELVIRRALEGNRLHAHKTALAPDVPSRGTSHMLGESAAMRHLRETIREVAQSDVTVLIQGESGSGKELVAQALHAASSRHAEAFVPIDCCTLQESLFESELFGHERGAFTGAERRKAGLIEAAAHGTLFLDEIGEAGTAIQAKLLRVLETGRFRHLGATTDLRSDARIVAATNRDLRARALEGAFREDLYYRLSTFVLRVPPLRERREDLGLLADHFIRRRRQQQGLPPLALSSQALDALMSYAWPGNVRELRNVIERALIRAHQADQIELRHLGMLDGAQSGVPAAGTQIAGAAMSVPTGAPVTVGEGWMLQGQPTLDMIERDYLAVLLKKYNGNRRKVADALGVSERTAYRMMDRHGYK